MKALFYNFSRKWLAVLFVMMYFWFFIPISMFMFYPSALTSALHFLIAGVVYIFVMSSYARYKFDLYISCLPISRSSFVSHLFIITTVSEIVMFIVLICMSQFFSRTEDFVFSSATVFRLLSSFSLGLCTVGLAMLLCFRFSYTVSYIFYIFAYFALSFIIGFIDGFFEGSNSKRIFESPIFCTVSAVILTAVYVFEWIMSIRIYRKRDL